MALTQKKHWRKNRLGLNLAKEMDLTILLPALLLAGIGIAMIYSATYTKTEFAMLYLKQTFMLSIGIIAMLVSASVNYQALLERYAPLLYWLIVIVLALLLAAGDQISGSKRWLAIGPIGVQPSEFAKIATTLVLARFLAKRADRIKAWSTLGGALLIAGLPMILILWEPDLGTTLVFIPMLFAMLYVVGIPVQRLLVIIGSGILASPLVFFMLKDYQRQRLMVFLNPSADTLGAGYNVIQSKIAIGSGGLTGKGWLQGTQGQLRFVPEHHTDFIFSVLAEEWGFLGSVGVIILFAVLLLQCLRIARAARDMGGSLVAVGLIAIIFTQVAVNLGVATGVMPVTGMTLPLISYGGSSIIVVMSMMGILMSVWSGRKVK